MVRMVRLSKVRMVRLSKVRETFSDATTNDRGERQVCTGFVFRNFRGGVVPKVIA